MGKWILAWLDVNYQTAYWESVAYSVAYNEWWLQLLLDLQQQQEQ